MTIISVRTERARGVRENLAVLGYKIPCEKLFYSTLNLLTSQEGTFLFLKQEKIIEIH